MTLPLGGDSSFYLDIYARYLKDRHSVPSDWALMFDSEEADTRSGAASQGFGEQLLAAYRRFGHVEAHVDPLGTDIAPAPELERLRAASADIGQETVELEFAEERRTLTIRELERLSRRTYCGTIGLDIDHLRSEAQRSWWYGAFERALSGEPERSLYARSLESVVLADEFETFMRTRFPTKKRFGCEGAESLIVFLREVFRAAPGAGIANAVVGGMHRGRLATLATAFGKSPATMIAEIMGRDLAGDAHMTGDVPYHLGFAGSLSGEAGELAFQLLPHPSHLMVVAPVALGLARATSEDAASAGGQTLCMLLHTDAAFAGQGLTSEIMQIGGLEGYSAGGAIHLVVNNQIGFTTLPSEGRSSHYCTDIGKAVDIPTLHVNADDPIAVARAGRLALAWNRTYRKDILIDLICYRRHGHNELDEPRFTQPEMCREIDGRPSVRRLIADAARAHARDIVEHADAAGRVYKEKLEEGFDVAADVKPNERPFQSGDWESIASVDERGMLEPVVTGIELSRLKRIGHAMSTLEGAGTVHPKVRKFYEQRADTISAGSGINFATAEALAFATVVADGRKVRMSGQDAVRGTFTQRHLKVHDMETGAVSVPLASAATGDGEVMFINSPLSEYGVLGFEYGHSLHDPHQLNVWEAQFGDFLNGAQIVVDQYIVSAESKWGVKSGLVIMLPHGLEGQGPDHSSSRIERIAQLYANGNIVLAQPSTPANLFHVLRRQVQAPWRKPLFLITPKSLLRHKAAVSDLSAMGAGTCFEPVLEGADDASKEVKRVVLCSGKVFYDIEAARRDGGRDDVRVVRLEQIYPFPAAQLAKVMGRYPSAECVWLQEEPENQGAWPVVRETLGREDAGVTRHIRVISRPPLPVSAGGSIDRHEREHAELIERALSR